MGNLQTRKYTREISEESSPPQSKEKLSFKTMKLKVDHYTDGKWSNASNTTGIISCSVWNIPANHRYFSI